jgi:putative addiction module component (TIGR02574 family)
VKNRFAHRENLYHRIESLANKIRNYQALSLSALTHFWRGKINPMSPEISDLLKRALALPPDERAALANSLLDSLDAPTQAVEEDWDKEVARRMEDLKAGKAVTVPWEQLHRELLSMVNER